MAEAATARLRLPRPGLGRIREVAEAAWPNEACGLLEGQAQGPVAQIWRVLVCHNEHEQPQRRYRIDPEAFLRADHAAARSGRRIVGVWHSHPNGAVELSDTDRRQAWPDWHYLVAALDQGRLRALRAWYIEAGGVRAARLEAWP